MISDSLNYLRHSDEALKTVLIGGLLTLLSFLLIPVFFVAGYLVRVLRRTAAGDEEPPVFEDWQALGMDGLKATIIAFVYGIVPAIVGFALVGGAALAIASGDGSSIAAGVGTLGLLFGTVVTLVLGLMAWYVIPAAIANFAERGTLAAGFDLTTLRPVLASRTYATGWLLALGVVVLGGVVNAVLGIVPLIGQLAGLFVGFYFAVAAYYIIGHTWADLRPVETREGIVDERPAV